MENNDSNDIGYFSSCYKLQSQVYNSEGQREIKVYYNHSNDIEYFSSCYKLLIQVYNSEC